MKQREAVFQSICLVLGKESFDGPVQLTTEQKEVVWESVAHGIEVGTVDLSDDARKKHNTPEKVMIYVKGLVNNWLRKDTNLNGGIKYVAKNPGSRTGQGDPMLKELRKLKKLHTGTEKEPEIDSYISTRQDELKLEKNKSIDINIDLIPEALRDLVS